jgi:ribonuclease HII
MAGGLSWVYEDRAVAAGHSCVTGVDEVGRGPLAGPVVAAAYSFLQRPDWVVELDDSKKLTAKRRLEAFTRLRETTIGLSSIAIIEADEIDSLNILQASLKAMRVTLEKLPVEVDYALIDGNRMPAEEMKGRRSFKVMGNRLP